MKTPFGEADRIISSVVKRRCDYIYYSECLPFNFQLCKCIRETAVRGFPWGPKKRKGGMATFWGKRKRNFQEKKVTNNNNYSL